MDSDLPVRDLLIEVQETQTAKFLVGAGITSNAGLLGNISYEQRNFDISNWPSSWSKMFSSRAFTGAGQYFKIQLEPGTEQSRASIQFQEPFLVLFRLQGVLVRDGEGDALVGQEWAQIVVAGHLR